MRPTTDLAIIGGGAAGLAAAVTAHECGDRVTIFEQGNTIGRKIAASGGGRCNLMNSGPLRFYGDAAFAEKVLAHCPQERLTRYWKYLGIYMNEETDGRLYPSTFRSGTVNDAYRVRLKSAGTKVLLQTFPMTGNILLRGFWLHAAVPQVRSLAETTADTGC